MNIMTEKFISIYIYQTKIINEVTCRKKSSFTTIPYGFSPILRQDMKYHTLDKILDL